MEALDIRGRADQAELGRCLARMHLSPPQDEKASAGFFGFPVSNTIGEQWHLCKGRVWQHAGCCKALTCGYVPARVPCRWHSSAQPLDHRLGRVFQGAPVGGKISIQASKQVAGVQVVGRKQPLQLSPPQHHEHPRHPPHLSAA